ncbi:MAG: hypothetical protein JW934_17580 [Anaerolineae bacterium]|nr:hypothetical protein [Anaerolineae bacterium]
MNKTKSVLLVLLILALAACKPTAAPTAALPTDTPQPAAPTFTVTAQGPTVMPTPTATSAPTHTPTPTPTPTPATVQIGTQGGELTSLDGRARLVFPAGAAPGPLTVSMQTRDRQSDDGAVLSPIIEIEILPALSAPLEQLVMLSLLQPPAEAPLFQFARLMTMPGQFKSPSGDPPSSLSYWLPLPQTRLDENGHPVLPLAQFSTYAPYTQTMAIPGCTPTTDELTPPPAPDGYVYIGVDVVINKVYEASLSTTPLTRQGTPDDLVYISSKTDVQDGATTCDIIVAHVFAPQINIEPSLLPCQPDPADLTPPEPPAGFVYVGVDVVVNGEWDETLSTVPLDRPESPNDLRTIHSTTTTSGQAVQCDIVVSHLFAPAPSGDTPAECTPGEDILQPPPPPSSDYVYVGREVVINNIYSEKHSTAPLGRPHASSDMVMASSSTVARNGVLICDIAITHIYARISGDGEQDAGAQDCAPTAEELAPPPAPEGYAYVGVDVVINGVWDDKRSTVPLDRPESPQDVNVMRSRTQVLNGVTVCDVVVRHLFAPIGYTGCSVPPEMLQMPPVPPCHRYVGVDVVINYRLVKSSVPLNRPFKSTDVVQISSQTTMANGQVLCDIIVAHTFEPIPCPPCKTIVPSQSEPSIYTKPTGTSVYFGPCAQLTADDIAKLTGLSITPPYIGQDGGLGITLPPGASVSYDGKNVIITMPNCP